MLGVQEDGWEMDVSLRHDAGQLMMAICGMQLHTVAHVGKHGVGTERAL